MNQKIFELIQKPTLYQKSERPFWDDPYIASQMLLAHLNPDLEAASRKMSFIDASVNWIATMLPSNKYPDLLDIGCGPGLYTERFFSKGYHVTGLDFSIGSIEYARQSAKNQQMDIPYFHQNYLTMSLDQTYDLCTLIYCDYGALSATDRATVMKNVYEHLKPGGMFLLDAFTLHHLEMTPDQNTWYYCKNNGFWRENEHIEISSKYRYSDTVLLHQATIIENDDATTYYIWNTCFSIESLQKEAEDAGFKVVDFYGDIAGAPYAIKSDTLAVLLQK